MDNKFTIDGLIFGITYYFVVRAENSHGLGMPSLVSEPVTIGLVSFAMLLLKVCWRFDV
jgi:roundabout axon guidance receptor 2